MKRVLAISPHLDDAVFSAGGTLAYRIMAGDHITMLTCFTGNVAEPFGFAMACQLDKGLDAAVDYMALRRAEDERACAMIGAEVLHWPYLEAPHRGYENAEALFADPRSDDDIAEDLATDLRRLLAEARPEIIYGPFGIGGHVDHVAVRKAIKAAALRETVIWWEDYPYAMRAATPPAQIDRCTLTVESATRKLAAVLCYESQIGFQFGGAEAAKAALAQWNVEGFARP